MSRSRRFKWCRVFPTTSSNRFSLMWADRAGPPACLSRAAEVYGPLTLPAYGDHGDMVYFPVFVGGVLALCQDPTRDGALSR